MSARPTQKFVKGQTILFEGQEGDRSYRILSGEVMICKKNPSGHLVPLSRLGAGEMFGEMYLFEPDNIRTATVIALSPDVSVEIFFHEEVMDMLATLSPTTRDIFAGLSRRLKITSGQYAEKIASKPLTALPDGSVKGTGTFIRHQI